MLTRVASAAIGSLFLVASWIAVEAHRVSVGARSGLERGFAPPAVELIEAGERHAGAALAALSDRDLDSVERLARYREQLAAAERLFVTALEVSPANATARLRLAAVRHELDAPETHEGIDSLMDQARALAPRRPDVHVALGELSLDLGHRTRGLEHLRRAIELDPPRASAVFAALARRGFRPQEIAALAPPDAVHLAQLAQLFFDEGAETAYIDLVEPVLQREPDPGLVARWALAHRRARAWSRLDASLTEMIGSENRFDPAQLRLERSRARMALGDVSAAHADAESAFEIAPQNAAASEQLGLTALAAGDPARSLVGYRASLATTVRGSADQRVRARLYRGIAEAEQELGHHDRAREARRHAAELDPPASAAANDLY